MKIPTMVVALILACAAPASAQWAVDGSIGFVAPTSGSGFDVGLDLMGAVERRVVPVLPLSLRLEVGWDHIGNRFVGVTEDITRFDLDVVIDPLLPGTPLRPYFLAGVGGYIVSFSGYHHTDPGLNIGGGLRYPVGPVQPFLEIRYHSDYASVAAITFVPVQFGVRVPLP